MSNRSSGPSVEPRRMGAPFYPVVVVGGGQAGLSLSHELCGRGVEHVVFERHRVGHAWREERWDTFCLVTPNWQCRLPGFPYAGDDPDGFMLREEIVAYLEGFAASFAPPLREGVTVRDVRRDADGSFAIETSAGPCRAGAVVAAVGGYHLPIVPPFARAFPEHVVQLHSQDYKRPEQLPPGEVLVVGTGQSGAQIAEDLHRAGRAVRLCVGDAPRVARRYRGRDVVAWLDAMGYYEMPVRDHPLGTRVRENTNHYVTGRDGGHDLDLRQFAREGMRLHGRLLDVAGGVLRFDDDLARNLDAADATSEGIKDAIDRWIAREGVAAPDEARYVPVWRPPAVEPCELALDDTAIASVVWCIGFRTDFSWLRLPVFDERGAPVHERGVAAEPGAYFLGLPWQHTWGSGRFSGVAADAAFLAERIVRALAAPYEQVAGGA